MRKELCKILVTGGAGFIGSAFVRKLLGMGINPEPSEGPLIVVDKLTYAGDLARLKEVKGKYKFYKADICDKKLIESIFKEESPDAVVNFAAETHVDRSIWDATSFIRTNVIGTQILLDISRKYKLKKFIHISTDEVYGEIRKGGFSEDSPLKPNSPYAASKAAADLLIKSYIRTYGFPAIIIRPCNNYGLWQYPEKLIPLAILKILKDEKIPVYAAGQNVREWLYVEDCARGISVIMKKGKVGEIYNLGSGQRKKNIEVVKVILDIVKKPQNLIQFVKDRLGHDWRYALNSLKVIKLGWKPKVTFTCGMEMTVAWNIANRKWLMNKV